jgi:hypothetical protein
LENTEKPFPVPLEVVGLNLLHPDRQPGTQILQLCIGSGIQLRFDRNDATAVLASITPLLLDPGRAQRSGRHHQNQVGRRVDSCFDLVFKVARRHFDPILPRSNVGLLGETIPQICCKLLVDSRVRDEDIDFVCHRNHLGG